VLERELLKEEQDHLLTINFKGTDSKDTDQTEINEREEEDQEISFV
jgi:hypothetical protein